MPDLFDYTPPTPPAPMMPFSIKRGIPLPSGRESSVKSTWDRPDFRFGDMDVDDCFDVWPHEISADIDLIRTQNLVSGSAATYRKKHAPEKVFTTRQIQGQFVRFWRVK